jgi:hypothetical protein
MSQSGLKLILKVTSVKWKACNIYCWPQCILGGIIALSRIQRRIHVSGSRE